MVLEDTAIATTNNNTDLVLKKTTSKPEAKDKPLKDKIAKTKDKSIKKDKDHKDRKSIKYPFILLT